MTRARSSTLLACTRASWIWMHEVDGLEEGSAHARVACDGRWIQRAHVRVPVHPPRSAAGTNHLHSSRSRSEADVWVYEGIVKPYMRRSCIRRLIVLFQ